MRILHILILCILLIAGCNKITKACINDKCYKLEIASSNEERRIGLMEHEVLASDAGMWFVFEEDSKQMIWMKNMKFPIDIIWIDSSYNVVDIKKDAWPCIDDCEIYSPKQAARYVLEVNANSGIEIGERVEIK